MPAITTILNTHIRKLARRELRPLIADARKRTAEHRRAIAALKRQVKLLQRELAYARKHGSKTIVEAGSKVLQKARLRIDGLKTQRKKLGLSAKDYGKLLGVSGLTIYNWEAGKSRPRRSQLPRIVSVRGIGKKEALRRLERE